MGDLHKLTIRADDEVVFDGIKRRFQLKGLESDSLTTLGAGEVLEDEFDIAETTDLSNGGAVTLCSSGLVPVVSEGSVTGYLPYSSNDLKIDVDGSKASQVTKALKPLDRRTKESCSNASRKSAFETSLANTVKLAKAAATAAKSGSATKFSEYFKTTSSSTRSVVAARLTAVANEAASTSSGSTTYYCSDPYGYCETNVLAYTLPSRNVIANCDIFYSELPALASTCHQQDQATTALHEFTHAPGVYSPGTDDLGYGYSAATSLSSAQAVLNADSYALYANGMFPVLVNSSEKCSRLIKGRRSDQPWLLIYFDRSYRGPKCSVDGGVEVESLGKVVDVHRSV